jgi:CcmD family protein
MSKRLRSAVGCAWVLGAVLVLAGSAVQARQQPPPAAAPSTRPADPTSVTQGNPAPAQDAFVPFKPGEGGTEVLPATPLVFIAYAFVWVALLAYVLSLAWRLRRVQDELANVHARLEKDGRR